MYTILKIYSYWCYESSTDKLKLTICTAYISFIIIFHIFEAQPIDTSFGLVNHEQNVILCPIRQRLYIYEHCPMNIIVYYKCQFKLQ